MCVAGSHNKPRAYNRCGMMCTAGSHNKPRDYGRCGMMSTAGSHNKPRDYDRCGTWCTLLVHTINRVTMIGVEWWALLVHTINRVTMIGVEHGVHCWFTQQTACLWSVWKMMYTAGSHNEPRVYDRCGTWCVLLVHTTNRVSMIGVEHNVHWWFTQ